MKAIILAIITFFAGLFGIGSSKQEPPAIVDTNPPAIVEKAEEITVPVVEPTTEPTTKPVVESVTEPTVIPTTEPTTVPTTEPVTEPSTEPAINIADIKAGDIIPVKGLSGAKFQVISKSNAKGTYTGTLMIAGLNPNQQFVLIDGDKTVNFAADALGTYVGTVKVVNIATLAVR